MPDAAYYRAWRAAHPEYRKRASKRRQERKRETGRGDRSKEYARRREQRVPVDMSPLPLLYPELQHGKALSFWEDELRIDVEQERALARLEGRDPDEAAKAYRARESAWHIVAQSPEPER